MVNEHVGPNGNRLKVSESPLGHHLPENRNLSVGNVFADQQILLAMCCGRPLSPFTYAASFRIEVVAAEKGCRAFHVILGHQQNCLFLANLQLASAHVVARWFAFT
jgi:hypothetical protein